MPPIHVNWDLTYACQLRCAHCYSQGGRRPDRALPLDRQRRIAGRLIEAGVETVAFAGGEPLLNEGLWPLAEQLREGGVRTVLYTNGLAIDAPAAARIARLFDRVHISLDAPHASMHDRIRGRAGAFAAALSAVRLLISAGASTGIDATLMRSTFDAAPEFISRVLPSVQGAAFLNIGAVIPAGMASRPGFGPELPTEAQMQSLVDGSLEAALRRLAPPHVAVRCFSNRDLSHGPRWKQVDEADQAALLVQLEPDGAMRAMPVYEGTVGSLLETPLPTLLARAHEWRESPPVRALLADVQDTLGWAAATRRLDWLHANTQVRRLIERRSHRIWFRPMVQSIEPT